MNGRKEGREGRGGAPLAGGFFSAVKLRLNFYSHRNCIVSEMLEMKFKPNKNEFK